jgi:hypothetical protein
MRMVTPEVQRARFSMQNLGMNAPTTRQTRAARAAAAFALYYQMGAMRSLDALYATLSRLGLRIARNTLDRYSVDYHWQARIKQLDAEDANDAEMAACTVREMNRRQATLGRMAQDIAATAFGAMSDLDSRSVAPDVAIRLAERGQHIERLAMGEVTHRSEVEIRVYSELVVQIESLFVEVNKLTNAAERDRRFRVGVDSLVEAHASGYVGEVRAIDANASANEAWPDGR